ncbi:hypothetical protein [Salinilacihabitans rarus]|uniref:hypothetical protein n=1 Tax=Salinilacihabitans rarus TaxID=2961596 RepID=UPI0020C87C61|nr:hypothetical protein [Salinilacihabitans rarus]
MNSKLISGSILTGFGTLAVVASSWARHFFFTQYHIARGMSLAGAGEFHPGPYGAAPEAVHLFFGTRVLLWVVTLLGLALVVWGLWADYRTHE